MWSDLISVFFSPVHLSLTREHVMPLLQGVCKWWYVSLSDPGVLLKLGVPETKQQEIREKHGPNEDKAVEECIEWWLEHATDVSWRKIIHSLDRERETNVADGLRQHAEPLLGTLYVVSSTQLQNVCIVSVRVVVVLYFGN